MVRLADLMFTIWAQTSKAVTERVYFGARLQILFRLFERRCFDPGCRNVSYFLFIWFVGETLELHLLYKIKPTSKYNIINE